MGKDYLLVFQLLSFPSRSSLVLLLLYGFLLYYLLIQSIYGMSKAITGFFFFVFWIPLLMLYFIPDWDYHRLTPYVFQDTRSKSSILAWAEAYQLFVGYELSLLLIPFCKKDGKWVKGLYIGQAMVCLTFIGANIIMAGYFSFDQLKKLTYPVISILSYVELPFLNRVEILSFTLFVFNNLSGTAMYSFAALLVLKRLFPSAKLKWLALGLVCYFLCLAAPIQLLRLSEQLHRCVNYIEIGFAFIGPFVLLFLLMTQRAARKGRAG